MEESKGATSGRGSGRRMVDDEDGCVDGWGGSCYGIVLIVSSIWRRSGVEGKKVDKREGEREGERGGRWQHGERMNE